VVDLINARDRAGGYVEITTVEVLFTQAAPRQPFLTLPPDSVFLGLLRRPCKPQTGGRHPYRRPLDDASRATDWTTMLPQFVHCQCFARRTALP
jgi:hypothetical protein